MKVKDKITKIINTAQKSDWFKYHLKAQHEFSLNYESGRVAYFKKITLDSKQEMYKRSVIGQIWIINGCNYDIFKTGWIQKYAESIIMSPDKIFAEESMYEDITWFVNEFLFLSEYEEITNRKCVREPISTLKEACISSNEYEVLKDWFVKMDFCDSFTFFWIDKKSGHKGLLSRYLWDSYTKKYTSKLTPPDIKLIAQNSFGVDINLSTIEHAKSDSNTKLPSFIK